MDELDYSASHLPIRDDLRESQRLLWEHLRSPGTWWTGAERLAIAGEARKADSCALCRERKQALSPTAVQGSHDSLRALPDEIVDVIHRIRTDPARLSHAWFENVIEGGLDEARYVELVAVVTLSTGIDYFARALGVPPFPFPAPLPGAPRRLRPGSAKPGTAWVAIIAPEDANGPEADLYGQMAFVPNIMRALSLVPNEARALQTSSNGHYVRADQIGDPSVRRALDRMQMELVAARVSALNECFY